MKRKMIVKTLLALIVAVSIVFGAAFSANAAVIDGGIAGVGTETVYPDVLLDGTPSYNVGLNNYYFNKNYSQPVTSYLIENSDATLTRVQCLFKFYTVEDIFSPYEFTNELYIENYSMDDYRLIGTANISSELEIFGGFFSGSKYNFFVFGGNNTDCDDSKEVVRVVRYSKAWKRLGSVSIRGANTQFPFDAGSLRMTEYGGKLYIHTCHTMYNKHQANMSFIVDEESDKLLFSNTGVSSLSTGYVSHSFNQFIDTDGKYVFRVDHGDCYPRGVTLSRIGVDSGFSSGDYIIALDLSKTGEADEDRECCDNWTGTQVGGFELTDTTCVIAGTTVNYKDYDVAPDNMQNLFVCVTDKNLNSATVNMITDYKSNSYYVKADNPQLVKINNNKLLLLWNEQVGSSSNVYDKEKSYSRFCLINKNGERISDIYNNDTEYYLSDCRPILCSDGLVRWVSGTDYGNFMDTIDPNNLGSCGIAVKKSNDYDYCITDGGAVIVQYFGTEKELKIPSSIDGYSVVGIGSKAFINNDNLVSVEIPNGVKEIDDYAFGSCDNLKKLILGSNVKSIGYDAFGSISEVYYAGSESQWSSIDIDFGNSCLDSATKHYNYHSGSDIVILGDANGDGEVTILDATAIQYHLASLNTASFKEAAADADEDGRVTIVDAASVQRHLASLLCNENIGKPM